MARVLLHPATSEPLGHDGAEGVSGWIVLGTVPDHDELDGLQGMQLLQDDVAAGIEDVDALRHDADAGAGLDVGEDGADDAGGVRQIRSETGWQAHTVRGFISRNLSKQGRKVRSFERVYRLKI